MGEGAGIPAKNPLGRYPKLLIERGKVVGAEVTVPCPFAHDVKREIKHTLDKTQSIPDPSSAFLSQKQRFGKQTDKLPLVRPKPRH